MGAACRPRVFLDRAVAAWLARARLPPANSSSFLQLHAAGPSPPEPCIPHSSLLLANSLLDLLPCLPRLAASRPLANELSTLTISAEVVALHLRWQSGSWVAVHGRLGSWRW